MMNLLPFGLRLLLAAVFLASGISKLYHLELTELAVAETQWFNWSMVAVVAKLLASLEIILGILLLFNPFSRNLVHKCAVAVLVLFSLFLVEQMIFKGPQEDCGCFPGMVSMSPGIALVRNLLMMGLGIFLIRKDQPGIFTFRLPLLATITVFVAVIILPFVLYIDVPGPQDKDYIGQTEPFEIMDHHAGVKARKTTADLQHGKYLVAFVSLTCPKCKLATKRLRILKQMYPSLPLVLIVNGDKEDFADFYKYTGAQDLEYIHFNGKEDFLRLSGPFLPNIIVTDHAVIKARLQYADLNENELGKYFDLK
jgi:uncharacterized membrane protein YphA (DoxX/SURF4 family)